MAYYPFATEIGARYALIGADGATAVFNDSLDPNYVGMLTEVVGLDSPDVRESSTELVEADGGTHGLFYYGRRPISLNGRIFNMASVAERNLRLDRARRASNALRTDATLSWKPSTRRENLVKDPGFEQASLGITNEFNNTGTCTVGVTTAQKRSGAQSLIMTSTAAGSPVTTGTSANTWRFPTIPGKSYTASAYSRAAVTSRQAMVAVRFFDSAGVQVGGEIAGASVAQGTADFNSRASVTAVCPTGASFAQVRLNVLSVAAAGEVFYWDEVLFEQAASLGSYFDGTTAGFYWQGAASASTSGDFIEMFVLVRRQQPFRESGSWVKEIQIPLVAASAFLYGTQLKTVAAGVAAENRGSAPAYPLVNITGPVTNPTISDGVNTFRTQNMSAGADLASGETMQVDMLNHTAKFTAGTRNGQSANRFINFSTTTWPFLSQLPNVTTTFTVSGGTASILYRDTWI